MSPRPDSGYSDCGVIAGGMVAAALGCVASQRAVQKTANNARMADLGIVRGVVAIPWGLLWWWIANEINGGPP